jgi:hypothetical protein
MDHCIDCKAYVSEKFQCHRYPKLVDYLSPDHWCLEFIAREVIACPVVEKEKVNEAKVEEKAVVSEPEIKKRGWPLGKPRK